jgi:fermentation-respiration switch protein FrsA (DUF1100 family)
MGYTFIPVLFSHHPKPGISAEKGIFASSAWPVTRLLVFILIGVALLMVFFEERFIFIPRPYDGSDAWRPPGGDYVDVHFQAADGTNLHGWYFQHPAPRAHVLHCHGNAGNITGRLEIARQLVRLGASVFLFDYRGYGRSEGSPTEWGVLEDARAARKEFSRRAGAGEAEIVLLGRSLGGGVAVDLAARDGARGLILESTFTDLPEVASLHYPFLPAKWLLRTRLDSLSKIRHYLGHVLQFHGTDDRIVPLEMGKRLFAAVPGREGVQKEFFLWDGGDHNQHPPPEYYEAMGRFFDRLPSD